MNREEVLEVEIGKIQERLENIPSNTPKEEVDWLKQKLNELILELDSLYVDV